MEGGRNHHVYKDGLEIKMESYHTGKSFFFFNFADFFFLFITVPNINEFLAFQLKKKQIWKSNVNQVDFHIL